VAIASGKNHVLALKSDGTVVRWGVLNSLRPLMPVGLSNVVAISGGFDHSLALKADGTVVAWQTMENVSVPANLSNVIHIAATAEGGMALRQDGAIVSFEKNFTETNQFTGVPIKKIATQLGPIGFLRVDGTITIPFPDATFSPVTNLFGAKDLDVGANTMLALRSDGTLVGFGGSPNGGGITNSNLN
jgi:alpha-tubulin suppressor-like RCC1 family protein